MINLKETVPSEAILIQVDKMFCIDGYIVFWFKLSTSGPEPFQRIDVLSQTHRITNQNGSRLQILCGTVLYCSVQYFSLLICLFITAATSVKRKLLFIHILIKHILITIFKI